MTEHDPLRDLGAFIREQRAGARLSLRRLSELAGISNPYLSQIERGLRRPSAEILQQIARGLRISAETLYVQAGILDERPNHGDLAEAILDEPSLGEEQKQTLLHIYRSFLLANEDRVPLDTTARSRVPAIGGPDAGAPAGVLPAAGVASGIGRQQGRDAGKGPAAGSSDLG